MRRFPTVVQVLLTANIAVFVAMYLVRGNLQPAISNFALFFHLNENFRPLQLLSHMFMHGGLAHLAFNMFAVYSFGRTLEQLWGPRRFAEFYLLCGVGAAAIHLLVSWLQFIGLQERLIDAGLTANQIQMFIELGRTPPGYNPPDVRSMLLEMDAIFYSPMLGASGALYGVLAAFGLTFPNAKLGLLFVPVPIAAKYFIPALLALDLLSGVTGFSIFGGGIAHFAHLGGAFIGFLLMLWWRRRSRIQPDPWRS